MIIETNRLTIKKFTQVIAKSVHLQSLDEDNRRFVPDEVFETEKEASKVIDAIISFYGNHAKPQIYAIHMKNNDQHIGHVQAVPLKDGWEIGYHIGKNYAKKGYATEAVKAFLPVIMNELNITAIFGIVHRENQGSIKVLTRCGFVLTDGNKSLVNRLFNKNKSQYVYKIN